MLSKIKEKVRFLFLNIRLLILNKKQSKSIGYFKYGRDIGSSWVVQQSMDVLENRGWDVQIYGSECNIIVVRNTEDEYLYDFIKKLKAQGKKIVWYLAETRNIINDENHISVKCWNLADKIIINSIGYKKHPNFKWWKNKEILIEESYPNDFDINICKEYTNSTEPKLVWHGFSHKMPYVIYGDKTSYDRAKDKLNYPFLGNLKELLPADLFLISQNYDGPIEKYKDLKPDIIHPGYPDLFNELTKFDIGVAPYALWSHSTHARPINKVAMYMIVGLPVIVVGIPEYKRWIKHKETGMIANTPEEWIEAVNYLKDPKERKRIGMNGRELIIKGINPKVIADKWESLFENILK